MADDSSYEELMDKYRKLEKRYTEVKRERDTYSEIFTMSPALLCVADFNTMEFLIVNPAFTDFLGYKKDELVGHSFIDFIHPDDVKSALDVVNKKLKAGERVINFANRYRCKDGSYRWLEWLSHPDLEKGVTFASAHDITLRKELETNIRKSELFVRTVMDNLPIGIAVNSVDPTVNFEYLNDNFTKFYRTTKQALEDPDGFWDSVYEDPVFREEIKERILNDCASEDPERMFWNDVPIERKGKETRYISARNIPIPDKGLMLSTVWDVTDRKRTEDQLTETKRLLEETQSLTKLGGWEYDLLTEKLIWTDEVFRIYGLDEIKNPVDKHMAISFYTKENGEKIRIAFDKAINMGETYDFRAELKRADGKKIWVRTIGKPVLNEGKVVRITGNIMDITELKEAETALKESEERFKALHNASFGGIAIHHRGKILDCNEGLSEITGFSQNELIGTNGLNLIKKGSRKAVMENFFSENEMPFESLCIKKDGEEIPVLLKSKKIPYKGRDVRVVEFRDMTEYKRAEEEREILKIRLTQAQKIEAIGTLAGGIAHDFNNILSLILGYSDMLNERFGDSIDNFELEQIIQAGKRAKDLVSQILAFSRQNKEKFEIIKPGKIIKETLKMLRSSIPSTIKIKQRVTDKGSIIGDGTQLHQIVMNLCTNAYHAMKQSGGTLGVTLKPEKIENYDQIVFSSSLSPGNYLKLEISDTGYGMDKVTKDKIFDPYFTTKDKGEGTGLGLSVVHGIVQNFNGYISVYSEPEEGSTFSVYFPLAESDELISDFKSFDDMPKGDEHLLIVDDEVAVADMEKKMLESLGYKISLCTGSREALNTFKKSPDIYNVVITDMTMPDMTGAELMLEIRKIKPGVPVILCSGFSDLINKEKAEKMGINKYLMKPVLKKDFALAIREVLDADKT